MNLYIIRHADAGNRDDWTGDDADRPLTDLGHKQARALGEALRHRGISFGAVVSSPMLRAKQTAEGVLGAWSNGSGPRLCDYLAQGEMRRRRLTKMLTGTGSENVAIVGHDPDLPTYLAWLIGAKAGTVTLEKAGVALVRFEDEPGKREGELVWVVTPEWYFVEQSEPSAV
jgi:phosphohistidine phosphatase